MTRIKGTVGSRVRIVLGRTGKEYLILLNPTNGIQKWQECFCQCIYGEIRDQMKKCRKKKRYVKSIDFNHLDAWHINGIQYDGSGNYHWSSSVFADYTIHDNFRNGRDFRVSLGVNKDGSESHVLLFGPNEYQGHNLPAQLEDRLNRICQDQGVIHFVRLFHDGKYVVHDSEGLTFLLCELEDYELWMELYHWRGKVEDVALAKDGSWVVIRENSFSTSEGMSSEVNEYLRNYFVRQRQRVQNRILEIRESNKQQIEQMALMQDLRATETLILSLEQQLYDSSERWQDTDQQLTAARSHFEQVYATLPPDKQFSTNCLPSTSSDVADDSEVTTSSICVICHDEEASQATVPCGHLCLCLSCATNLVQNRSSRCPLCRTRVNNTLRIYR